MEIRPTRKRRRPGVGREAEGSAGGSTRLCIPAPSRRCYATALTDADHILGPRVLAQSLRAAGAEASIVVVVSASRADADTVALLESDGMRVRIVPETIAVGGRDVPLPPELLAKISLWSLLEFDRVVYLDSRALVQKNTDSLFACDGFCAALPADAGLQATMARKGTRQAPSVAQGLPTGVMVLEPHAGTHAAMLAQVTANATAAAIAGGDGFLQDFFRMGDGCPLFQELSGLSTLAAGGRDGAAVTGGGGGSHGHSVLLLNAAHMPKCAPGMGRAVDAGGYSAPGVAAAAEAAVASREPCRRLPYTYAAPSADYHGGSGDWGRSDCAKCERVAEPHVIRFGPAERPWDGLSYLQRPLLWRWDQHRAQLRHSPYGDALAPWVLFLVPCLLLLAARLYHNLAAPLPAAGPCGGVGGGSRSPRSSSDASDDAESGISGGGSGGGGLVISVTGIASGGSSRASPRTHAVRGGVQTIEVGSGELSFGGSGGAGSPNGGAGAGGICLPMRLCYALAALTAVAGAFWYEASLDLAMALVRSDWHPIISILVYNAWLCCALVLGLYLVDYAYFIVATGGKTLPKDLLLAALALMGLQLHAVSRYAAAGAVGAAVVLLGCAHGSRAAGARLRLSSTAHYRWLTFSCAAFATLACAACWGAVAAGGAGGVLRRLHQLVAPAHVALVALIYASMVGGDSLRKDLASPRTPVGFFLTGGSRRYSWTTPLHRGGNGGVNGGGFGSVGVGGGAAGSAAVRGGVADAGALVRLGAAALPLLRRLASRLDTLRRLLWRRRLAVALCCLLWAVRVVPRLSRPNTVYFGFFTQQCLMRPGGGFISSARERLSPSCGDAERFRPVATGRYFEAFRQYKVCLEASNGRFLTLARGRLASACVPENQFVFQPVAGAQNAAAADAALGGSEDGSGGEGVDAAATAAAAALTASGGGAAGAAEEFCIYNPATGLYLSERRQPQAHCRETERWHIAPVVPEGPGIRAAVDSAVAMLEPHFASRSPLTALLTYLGLAAALLQGRAWLGGPTEPLGRRPAPRWQHLGAPARKLLRSAAAALAARGKSARAPLRAAVDGLLLAGLWILLPVHLVQTFSVLVGDHTRAVGLATSLSSRGSSFGALAGGGGFAMHRQLGEARAGEGAGDGPWWWPPWLEDDAAAALCGPWVGPLAAFVLRWHLAAAVLAACHAHCTAMLRRRCSDGGGGGGGIISISIMGSGSVAAGDSAPAAGGAAAAVATCLGLAVPEGLASRMRVAAASSALLCGAVAAALPLRHMLDFDGVPWGGGGCGPGWVRDDGWATVSPLLFFSVIFSAAGVYRRAGANAFVRGTALAAAAGATAVVVAVHPRYLLPAVIAAACNWVAWALAGAAIAGFECAWVPRQATPRSKTLVA